MEYYFDPDDKLERRKYAEFLKSMLENCDKYRREDSDGAYVIAIDSPWGTGKTRFAKMLRNYLEGREPKLIDGKVDRSVIPGPADNRMFNVVYYNSWESDYWTDAIEPLMESILNSEAFFRYRKNKKNKDNWAKLIRFTKGVLKASGYAIASKAFGETAIGVIKEGLSEMKKTPINPIQTFTIKSALYREFSSALEQVITQIGKPLVIIVDELDRCRPTFAIQTLELAKHLFDVKGLLFIFALDIKQLSSSVKTVYGEKLDATGYLCRFFDYIGKTPLANIEAYIKILLDQYGLSSAIEERDRFFYYEQPILDEFVKFIATISKKCEFSYRDLATLLATYRMMYFCFINRYKYFEVFKLYFLLLAVKYRDPNLYNEISSEAGVNGLELKITNSILSPIDEILKIQLQSLESKERINNKVFEAYLVGPVGEEDMAAHGVQGNPVKISMQREYKIRKFYVPNHIRSDLISNLLAHSADVSFGLVLFNNDFENWESIRSLTPMQYYHQQLEMFNFALPADDTKSKD